MTSPLGRPLRVFLDSGVIIEGCVAPWGASKGVLILATVQSNFTIVLAEAVEREVVRAITNKAGSDGETASALLDNLTGWLARVRLECHPRPSEAEAAAYAPSIMPALRHYNDLDAVVTAIKTKPDWVLSTNTAHWNQRLAERTGLRIATPSSFLTRLVPQAGR
jgi:hypothetical protein